MHVCTYIIYERRCTYIVYLVIVYMSTCSPYYLGVADFSFHDKLLIVEIVVHTMRRIHKFSMHHFNTDHSYGSLNC